MDGETRYAHYCVSIVHCAIEMVRLKYRGWAALIVRCKSQFRMALFVIPGVCMSGDIRPWWAGAGGELWPTVLVREGPLMWWIWKMR